MANLSLWQEMSDTDECTRPRWDVADGIASSDDGLVRRLTSEVDLPAGFPDEAVGDTDAGTDGVGNRLVAAPDVRSSS